MTQDDPLDRFRLDDRVALVTGASSGLGRHFALALAKAGARVALCARRMDKLEETASLIAGAGGEAYPIAMDVTDAHSVRAGFEEADKTLGALSILVNNAGVPSGSFFLNMSEEEWRRVLGVNLDGVFRVAQEAARRMQQAGSGGSIVNIASVLGLGVIKSLSAYCTSKAAVIQLTRAMALELARENIRVNALAPGYIATEMNTEFLASPPGQALIGKVPQKRAGDLADLDGPLLLLASDAGAFMTGSVLSVDGGGALAMG
jgi:NAD(P)-dependent dehydrogenase (short-subunit alcohol dehydrogenase family)